MLTKKMRSIAVALSFALCIPLALPAAGATSNQNAAKPAAKSTASTVRKSSIARNPYLGAIVVDAGSGRVLFEDRADDKGYPASMLKLMDLLIILEKIRAKQLGLDDQVTVSRRASQTGGSQVWLAEKESFSVEDLLYALMVQSANDAAVALAEKIGGSVDGFVSLMNAKAGQLGMNSTTFASPHGLPPSAGQQFDVTTARDFSLLCRELLKYPEALRYTSTRERTFRPNVPNRSVVMRTHNHLLGSLEGCDGLKTGFINAAGYSIAVTAARNGQRVITVVLGSVDRKVRDAKASELVARGFAALGSVATISPGAQPAAVSPGLPNSKPAPK